MEQHVCPWWIGYILASPIRKWSQDPDKILEGHVREGMTVLDAGSAMGFFSIPMAELVGPEGKVICVDLQERMLNALKKRAVKRGLDSRMVYRKCTSSSLNIDDLRDPVDFALAFAVVHEVPDKGAFFSEIYRALKKGGTLLFSEPKGHISEKQFSRSLEIAEDCGFIVAESPEIKRGRTVLLKK